MAEEKFKPGLEGIYAGQTTIAEVTQTGLRYRGYDISDLANNTCFEEVAHALLHGDLPTKAQLADFRKRVQAAMKLPEEVASVIRNLPKKIPPMEIGRAHV